MRRSLLPIVTIMFAMALTACGSDKASDTVAEVESTVADSADEIETVSATEQTTEADAVSVVEAAGRLDGKYDGTADDGTNYSFHIADGKLYFDLINYIPADSEPIELHYLEDDYTYFDYMGSSYKIVAMDESTIQCYRIKGDDGPGNLFLFKMDDSAYDAVTDTVLAQANDVAQAESMEEAEAQRREGLEKAAESRAQKANDIAGMVKREQAKNAENEKASQQRKTEQKIKDLGEPFATGHCQYISPGAEIDGGEFDMSLYGSRESGTAIFTTSNGVQYIMPYEKHYGNEIVLFKDGCGPFDFMAFDLSGDTWIYRFAGADFRQ